MYLHRKNVPFSSVFETSHDTVFKMCRLENHSQKSAVFKTRRLTKVQFSCKEVPIRHISIVFKIHRRHHVNKVLGFDRGANH